MGGRKPAAHPGMGAGGQGGRGAEGRGDGDGPEERGRQKSWDVGLEEVRKRHAAVLGQGSAQRDHSPGFFPDRIAFFKDPSVS